MEENTKILNTNEMPAELPIKPEKKKFLNKKWLVLGLIVLVLIIVGASASYFFLNSNKQVTCTTEAKLCPDGSYVARTGPNCEFAKCPTATPTPIDETANWKTYVFPDEKITIKLPLEWEEYQITGAGHPEKAHFFASSNPKNMDKKQEDLEFGYWTGNSTFEDVENYYKENNAKNFPINEKVIIDRIECLFSTSSKPMGQSSLNPPMIDTYLYSVDCASKENKQFTFSFSSRNHKADLLFNQILSTFKFTE